MTSNIKALSHYKTSTGVDWAPILQDLEREEKIQNQTKARSNHVTVICTKWELKKTTLYRYYNKWTAAGRPNSFVMSDQRKNKTIKLPMEVEQQLVTEIKQAYEKQSALPRKVVQSRAVELWNNL